MMFINSKNMMGTFSVIMTNTTWIPECPQRIGNEGMIDRGQAILVKVLFALP